VVSGSAVAQDMRDGFVYRAAACHRCPFCTCLASCACGIRVGTGLAASHSASTVVSSSFVVSLNGKNLCSYSRW
jgi:hypothetical protein